jgi:hypothetical protein
LPICHRTGENPLSPCAIDVPGEEAGVVGEEHVSSEVFIWSNGRGQLELKHEGNSWSITYFADSVLFGDLHKVYHATHREPFHAAADVLNRVRGATHDDETGVEVAQEAARWMRLHMGGGSASRAVYHS